MVSHFVFQFPGEILLALILSQKLYMYPPPPPAQFSQNLNQIHDFKKSKKYFSRPGSQWPASARENLPSRLFAQDTTTATLMRGAGIEHGSFLWVKVSAILIEREELFVPLRQCVRFLRMRRSSGKYNARKKLILNYHWSVSKMSTHKERYWSSITSLFIYPPSHVHHQLFR